MFISFAAVLTNSLWTREFGRVGTVNIAPLGESWDALLVGAKVLIFAETQIHGLAFSAIRFLASVAAVKCVEAGFANDKVGGLRFEVLLAAFCLTSVANVTSATKTDPLGREIVRRF